MTLSCIISETKRYISRKSRFFHTILHLTSPLGGRVPVGVFPHSLVRKKLERCGYPKNGVATQRWNKFDDMFSRFDVEQRHVTDGHLATA